jgi:hypothetical protein
MIHTKNYSLYTEDGQWLGQIVITSDGMFASVTDYGNLSYAWRSFGKEDFRKFLSEINVDYFGTKLYTGMTYILHTRKCEQACHRFAEKILPALQKVLKEELAENKDWEGNCTGNCGMGYCDENGCLDRKKVLTEQVAEVSQNSTQY